MRVNQIIIFLILIFLLAKELFIINYEAAIIIAEIILAIYIYKLASPFLNDFFLETKQLIKSKFINLFDTIISTFFASNFKNHLKLDAESKEILVGDKNDNVILNTQDPKQLLIKIALASSEQTQNYIKESQAAIEEYKKNLNNAK